MPIFSRLLVLLVVILVGSASAATKHNTVPDVRGMIYGKAKAEVAVAGFNLKQAGQFRDGDVVGEQVPRAGELLPFDGWVAVVPTKAVPAQAPAASPPPAPVPEVKPEPKPAPKHKAVAGVPKILPPLTDGVYILTVKDGAPSLSPAEYVPVGPPGPGPGPTPTPAPASDLSKAIKAAADKATGDPNRGDTCQGLAKIYRDIAAASRNSTATTETITDTTKQLTDLLLAHQGTAAKTAWQPVRDVLTKAFVDATADDKSPAEFADLLDQAAAGLEASAPQKAISPEFWTFLLELLKLLIPLLIPK